MGREYSMVGDCELEAQSVFTLNPKCDEHNANANVFHVKSFEGNDGTKMPLLADETDMERGRKGKGKGKGGDSEDLRYILSLSKEKQSEMLREIEMREKKRKRKRKEKKKRKKKKEAKKRATRSDERDRKQ